MHHEPEACAERVVLDPYFTLLLDNGQVWQQINGDDDFAILKEPAQEYEVTIKHGFFGSYNLTFTGVAGLFRVRRFA